MNVLDTSAWLEILTGGPKADHFLGVARINGYLLVPSLVVAEVVHHVHGHLGDGAAIDALAALSRGTPVPFTASMAGAAARAAEELGLSFRNSLIYAQARHCAADLWTMEPAFERLPGVRYVPRLLPDRPTHREFAEDWGDWDAISGDGLALAPWLDRRSKAAKPKASSEGTRRQK